MLLEFLQSRMNINNQVKSSSAHPAYSKALKRQRPYVLLSVTAAVSEQHLTPMKKKQQKTNVKITSSDLTQNFN